MYKKAGVKKRILRKMGRTVNFLIPKISNSIYAEPHMNCKKDKYDLINCNSDNCLKTLNYFMHHYTGRKVKIYIEVYDMERIKELRKYVEEISNEYIDVVFIETCWDQNGHISFKNMIAFLRNTFYKYRSSVWICDTGWAHFFDNTKKQKLISFNYGVPFKKGGLQYKDFSFDHFSYIVETSYTCSKMISSEYEASIDKFVDIGFSRNDTISQSDKKEYVNKWLKEKCCYGKKIIVYVPTFRKQQLNFMDTNVFGMGSNEELLQLLKDNDAVIITKLHPHQKVYSAVYSDRVIAFEANYDFSIYDLFSVTDVVISDYSSISTDFLLSHKPVIYQFNDYNEYEDSRGFSFDPIQDVCCGEVVYNWEEMKEAIRNALNGTVPDDPAYDIKFRIWFKNDDFHATERNYELLKGQLCRDEVTK